MWVLFVVIAVLVVAVTAALASGKVAFDPMSEATTTRPIPMAASDAAGESAPVRFDVAFRGYRMEQVDAVIDDLRAQLARARGEDTSRAQEPAVTEPTSAGQSGQELGADAGRSVKEPAESAPAVTTSSPVIPSNSAEMKKPDQQS